MDQPSEPTRVFGNGGMIYRNFTFDMERARQRAAHAYANRYEKPFPWEGMEEDVLLLALLAQALVEDKLELNKWVPANVREDLCPCCGGRTWGRPGLLTETESWEKRRCNVCSWIRPNPPEDAS